MKQKPWDRYEAALLLSYCLKIEAGDIPRKEAVDIVSNTLRKRAEVQGVEIDETFRNTNGISMQMSAIRNCYLGKDHGLAGSKLFHEMVDLYKSNHDALEQMLTSLDVKPKDAKSIVKSYKRIMETPFGTTLNFGYFTDDENIVRLKWSMSDNRVFLYALYRFVEKCNLNREFNVSYLFDESIERDGVSPVRLFGLYDEEELRNVLLGLSARYPNFINATYTNDLQSISLRDKSSSDVLKLFEEEY